MMRWARRGFAACPWVAMALAFAGMVIPKTRGETLWLLAENRPVELTTFGLLVVIAGVAARLAQRLRQRGERRGLIAWYWTIAGAMLLAALEEVAWGQHLLGFEPPSAIERLNAQGELTLHNIRGVSGNTEFLRIGYALTGLLALTPAARRRLGRLAVPRILLSWFVIIGLHAAVDLYNDYYELPAPFHLAVIKVSELNEMLIALSFLVYVACTAAAIASSPKPGTPRRPGSPTVLVFGHYRASFVVVRSLAAAGYRVIVGDGGEAAFVHRTRHCAEVWRHPSLLKDEPGFSASLLAFLATRPDIDLVFPVTQAAVVSVARVRARLPRHVTPVIVSPELVRRCLDKHAMFDTACELGVPVEAYATAANLPELRERAGAVEYPCIVRPVGSGPERLPGGAKASICSDATALRTAFESWPEGHPSLLVQRYAPGFRHNVYFAAHEGRMLGSVEARVLRTNRWDGTGFTVEAVSVAPDPIMTAHCRRLLEHLRYTGFGCANFLVTEKGMHFLEINPRLGASVALAQHCGLDLPRLGCELALGGIGNEGGIEDGDRGRGSDVDDGSYPAGERYAWSFGDLRALRQARVDGEVDGRDAWRWLGRALRSGLTASVHATWVWHDPLPTLCLYGYWLPRPWRRAQAPPSPR